MSSEYITEEVERLLDRHTDKVRAAAQEVRQYVDDRLREVRTPSKAAFVFGPDAGYYNTEPQAGRFLSALLDYGERDPETVSAAKASLEGMGARYERAWGKATLGTTDATGGWVIPNAIVDEIQKPASFQGLFRNLLTVRPGITAAAVDLPWRSAAPARAVIAAFGATKENVDLAYNGYTATMYTLARIHDIGNQFLRQSAGAAEADVLSELASAFARGEDHYVVNGTGSSEPYGLVTALNGSPAHISSFTPAATLAGSILAAIGTAAGALAARERMPSAAVMHPTPYWQMLRQGADAAGFYIAGTQGFTLPDIPAGTVVSPFGIPVFPSSAMPTDDLIVGDFKAARLFLGENFRIDTSNQAGTRWDTNVTGFRGEEELGFDARPSVYAGAFELIQDVTP